MKFNISAFLELIKLADKIVDVVDLPSPTSEEAKHKQWLESGYAISAYREARAKLQQCNYTQIQDTSKFWEILREASESMQYVLEVKLPKD